VLANATRYSGVFRKRPEQRSVSSRGALPLPPQFPVPLYLLTSNLTRPRSPLTTHGLAVVLFFLSSSLNYWKQNGLRTKTQADVGWLIMACSDWRPCQMKNGLEKLLSRKIRGTCCPFLPFISFFLFCSFPFVFFSSCFPLFSKFHWDLIKFIRFSAWSISTIKVVS